MGIDEVLKLIESLQDTDIQELEISNGDSKVRIVRLMPVPVAAVPQGIQVVPVVPTPTTDVSIEDEGGETNHSYIEVTSPMVGTFYRATEPDSDPFVKEREEVISGQQLCIIEAMKLMNELECEVSGVIREICVDNGEPVEFGQVLFRVSP